MKNWEEVRDNIKSISEEEKTGIKDAVTISELTCKLIEHMREIEETPLKTIREWDEVYGITVYDPDGFDRSDPFLFKRVFTEGEYLDGVQRSTCMFNREGLYWEKFIKPQFDRVANNERGEKK